MTFQEDIFQLHQNNQQPKEESMDFPECRGMTFQQFWAWANKKSGMDLTFYDYEEELEITFRDFIHIWIKKSAGLGITEFVLRWISWNCLKDDVWKDKQIDVNIPIVVGPRVDLAITILTRFKHMFGDHQFKGKETVLTLNGNRIEVFPSHNMSSVHGLNPVFILLDEGDLFPPGQQIRARQASERYVAKTNPYIVWISTPYLPGGLYETIEREENCMYERKIMLYDRGLGKVYSEEDIAIARLSPTFEMEYNGKYGYGVGNIFQGLDSIIEEYDVTPSEYGQKALCGDPAFGSSNFGICGGETLDSKIWVKEANQHPRPSPSAMLDIMEPLAHQYNDNVKIDGAHPGFIRDLNERGIPALPINFGLMIRDTEDASKQSLRSKMTINAAQMVKNGLVRIHPMFTDLIAQLRAAQFDDKGGVDKKELNFDIGDAFIMMCWDLKEFDYSSIGLRSDGTIYGRDKPKSKSVKVNTEVIS